MMFDGLMREEKKQGRGTGKRPALKHLSLRIPKDVMDFFDQHYPRTKQAKMREILTDFINKEMQNEKAK